MRKNRKYTRNAAVQVDVGELIGELSLVEAFERFMSAKRTEGLARRTSTESLLFEIYININSDGYLSIVV